ncbi:MAG TPA: hypothetical protein QF821_02970 [Candidatus Thalassarchaeaceae archaeon]|jgi:hypothetical protein|nr:hypothetical protein [Candidatus Thalassarchaeaceae archaeon]
MSEPESLWWLDPMVWLGLLQGSVIWLVMAVYLSIPAAWISLACGGLIGFFLYLVALGYEDYRFAKATAWGVVINTALSSISLLLAFTL